MGGQHLGLNSGSAVNVSLVRWLTQDLRLIGVTTLRHGTRPFTDEETTSHAGSQEVIELEFESRSA